VQRRGGAAGSHYGSARTHGICYNRPFFRGEAMTKVLECLKKHGQRLDLEIASETGVPLAAVREQLASLAATGAIVACSLTRFEGGKRTDALQCRMSGYVPPQAPGRKSKAAA
jgi:hypothetical protein